VETFDSNTAGLATGAVLLELILGKTTVGDCDCLWSKTSAINAFDALAYTGAYKTAAVVANAPILKSTEFMWLSVEVFQEISDY